MARKKPIVIDIFAGCGGLSLGLYQSGWKGFFAIEKDKMAFETLRYNLICKKNHFSWPDWLPQTNHDIDEIINKYEKELKELRGTIGLVAGGPPCQGFSTAGKRQENDKRNKLIHSYIKFVEYVRPRIILFENVKGFTLSFNKNGNKGKAYSEVVLNNLKNIGYEDIRGEMIDFAEFGIPQRRKRFIIVGTIEGKADYFFDKLFQTKNQFLSSKNLIDNPGVSMAISDLKMCNGVIDCPDTMGFKSGIYRMPQNNYQILLRKSLDSNCVPDSHRFVNHRSDTVNIYQQLLKHAERNVNISDKLKEKYGITKRNLTILDSRQQSPTLMSIPDDYVHYCEPRVLTVREYARIQSFPDWFEFKGKYTTGGKLRVQEVPRYTQIGNAIPPLFAEHAGNVLKELLDNAQS